MFNKETTFFLNDGLTTEVRSRYMIVRVLIIIGGLDPTIRCIRFTKHSWSCRRLPNLAICSFFSGQLSLFHLPAAACSAVPGGRFRVRHRWSRYERPLHGGRGCSRRCELRDADLRDVERFVPCNPGSLAPTCFVEWKLSVVCV